MNKVVIGLIIVLVILGGFFLAAQNKAPESDNLENSENSISNDQNTPRGDEYKISTTESQINWAGRKTLIPDYTDRGTLTFKSGEFFVENGVVTSGRAVFDMNSIKVSSTGILKNEDLLEKHLKSADFFSVETHPEAELLVTSFVPSETSGQFTFAGTLTIKGITQDISFPATVEMKAGEVIIDGEASLDRTLWDIRFGSDKFFDNLANNVIDDFFTVGFHVVAKAKASVQ